MTAQALSTPSNQQQDLEQGRTNTESKIIEPQERFTTNMVLMTVRSLMLLMWKFLPDMIVFTILFLIFYNNYGGYKSPQGADWYVIHAPYPSHTQAYRMFDLCAELLILPLLFSALLLVYFLQ